MTAATSIVRNMLRCDACGLLSATSLAPPEDRSVAEPRYIEGDPDVNGVADWTHDDACVLGAHSLDCERRQSILQATLDSARADVGAILKERQEAYLLARRTAGHKPTDRVTIEWVDSIVDQLLALPLLADPEPTP